MMRIVCLFLLIIIASCSKKSDQLAPQMDLISEQAANASKDEQIPYGLVIDPGDELVQSVAARASAHGPAWSQAIEESLSYVRVRPHQEQVFSLAGIDYTWAHLGQTLAHLQKIMPHLEQDPQVLRRDFIWYKISPDFLLTGYYEPELEGSLEPGPDFLVPIWGLPPTLRTVDLGKFHPRWQGQTLVYQSQDAEIIPFYTRHEIDGQEVLAKIQKPIAWAKDAVDVFFLHIQGSGRLRLPDGQVVHILYAGKNGHEYVSVGKIMIEQGILAQEKMSMQAIRDYLRNHPDQIRSLLDTNPSYVFFRLADSGPLGAMGRALTPMISVATDSDFLPLGAVLAVDATWPCSDGPQSSSLLTLAQDRGGAIKKARLDLFCGAGQEAEFLAGHLRAQGQVFLLLKKQDVHD